MYIDDFIWLPDIIEKLNVKHQVTQDEVEEVFFNHPVFALSKRGITQMKMCIQPPDKPTQEGTYSCFSSESHTISL